MSEPEIAFPTPLGDVVRVRVVQAVSAALTREQRFRNRTALGVLRFGLDVGDPASALAAERLHRALHGRDGFVVTEPGAAGASFRRGLLLELEQAFELGRLLVTAGALPLLGVPAEFELSASRPRPPAPPPPAPPPARPPAELTLFDVRFVDEIGQAIGGIEVEFNAGARQETLSTNPAGVALLEDVEGSSATVSVVDLEALEDILEPRWATVRAGTAPGGVNTKTFAFGSALSGISLKPAVPNTVVVTPVFGKLSVELWDKIGRVRHADTEYSIEGPASFSGKTDEVGRLLHEEVPPGDYELTLKVDINRLLKEGEGGDSIESDVREFKAPLVVLEGSDSSPEVRLVGAYRSVVMARVRGMLFDTNKNFILNRAIPDLKGIRRVYELNNPGELLLVGHTDTTAQPSINDPLSVERADSVRAYLEDDVDAWLAMFGSDKPESKRWGEREDLQMIEALPDASSRDPEQDPVRWFQATRRLEVDGIAGDETRRQLIFEYMRLDGTTLRDNPDFDIEITTHGCGENFPLDDTGEELDSNPPDEKEDQLDRRAELFFFDREFGIDPPVPGKNSPKGGTQYPEWRKRATIVEDFAVEGDVPHDLRLLGFDLQPAPAGTPCQIRIGASKVPGRADENGVVRFAAPKNAKCEVEWELPAPDGGGSLVKVAREDIDLGAILSEETVGRLNNLGHLQPDLEDQVRSFQRELEQEETGIEADIKKQLIAWHDGGAKPTPASFSDGASLGQTQAKTGGSQKAKQTTILFRPQVVAFKGAPVLSFKKDTRGSIWRMDVLRGTHTAITFIDAADIVIRSNNPVNAVPEDPEVFLDPAKSSKKRTIFFWAKRFPKTSNNSPQVSLFEERKGNDRRTLLQVRVFDYGRNHIFTRLFGPSVALNSPKLTPYNMDRNFKVSDSTKDPAKSPGALITPDQIFDTLEKAINGLGGRINHLVINSHGDPGGKDGALIRCGHDFQHFEVEKNPRPEGAGKFNVGFSRHNLAIWARLKDKVRFIWFQSCAVGSDNALVGAIAQNTGAFVSAPGFFTGLPPKGLPKSHIEYLHDNQIKHFDPSTGLPMEANDFFKLARRSKAGNLKNALFFNVIRRGPPFPKSKGGGP